MRPKIICHMVSSVDGRLLVDRWTPHPGGETLDVVLRAYDEAAARLGGEGWIVGRATMQEAVGPMSPRASGTFDGRHEGAPEIHVADRRGRDVAVALDPHGKVRFGRDNVGGDHAIAVLGTAVSASHLSELRENGVSYLFAGEDGRDLDLAMDTLGDRFGLATLLLEGGGTINGAFLKAGLIDEVSLLVYPGVDGLSGIPSIFEFKGERDERPAGGQSLRHLSTETLEGGIAWLRYEVRLEPAT